MSIAQLMNELVGASNDKYNSDVNEIYASLIRDIKSYASHGKTSYMYCTSGPFNREGALYITGQLRSRLLRDGFTIRDAYSIHGIVVEVAFHIKW